MGLPRNGVRTQGGRTVTASHYVDADTYQLLCEAARRDENELPTLAHVLSYCLQLGIESYLSNQPEEQP